LKSLRIIRPVEPEYRSSELRCTTGTPPALTVHRRNPKMQTPTKSEVTRLVLAAVDLAVGSEDVLRAAAKLAATTDSELHVVHVVPHDAAGSLRGDDALRFSNLTDDVRAKLEELGADLPATLKRIALHVRIGSADLEIAQLASDLAADLVVVGTHGHTGLERLVLGSVGASLIRNAPCPVLVCRPKTVAKWEKILPPCADCRAVQQSSGRKILWCERHAAHHPRAHTYSEVPTSFGIGAQTFR
jgi:nucleotide-binding universal stress UspA family protein